MLTTCLLQLFLLIERQVFDFLGFLWIPILANFFAVIFTIFGFFGAFQFRPKYLLSYALWNLFWLGWNVFLICLYLDVGVLRHKESKVLKLDPDSGSWWENGPGCKGVLNTTAPIPMWENVTNCLVDYRHVEIFQAGMQCLLSFIGALLGFYLSKVFLQQDDTSSRKVFPKRQSLYSIEFSPQLEGRNADPDHLEYDEQLPATISPKPMTPRRVKRRSVMTRGSSTRQSSGSRRHHHHSSSARSSTRSSRRAIQNPVTRLLEQQQNQRSRGQAYDSSATSASPTEPLPGYYSSNNLIHPTWQNNGHTNPTYQQSSIQSLNDADDLDELYNNRPASARSSYSNFHGTRVISHGGGSNHYANQATPQVPQKRSNNLHRHSMRSMVFLNSGPPAYTFQGHNHVSPDSETTI